jgi:hypothetical protein
MSAQTLPSLYPDLPLDTALRFVNNVPFIPVVNRADSRKLEGLLSSESVFTRYQSKRP